VEKLAAVLSDAQVDLNPHQIEAALFAFRSPLSKGAILADEVGLGKTIEAGILLAQKWPEPTASRPPRQQVRRYAAHRRVANHCGVGLRVQGYGDLTALAEVACHADRRACPDRGIARSRQCTERRGSLLVLT
jgi:hypothetical protein